MCGLRENFPPVESEGMTKAKMLKPVLEIIFSTLIIIMMMVMMMVTVVVVVTAAVTELTQVFGGTRHSAGL